MSKNSGMKRVLSVLLTLVLLLSSMAVAGVSAGGTERSWTFESETVGSTLDLNTTSTEVITVTDEAKHAGSHAVRVNSSDSSGSTRAQMNVKDDNGTLVQVEAGKDYSLSFWVMVPQGGHNFPTSVWFTAVPEDKKDTPHSSSFNKNTCIIGTEQNVDQAVAKGEWQQITYTVDDCAFSGYLRIGLAAYGANKNAVVFYVDDIKVESAQIDAVPPMEGAWSFESESTGVTLDINTSSSETLTVTNEVKHTGSQAVRVNSANSSGNGRAQMNVKDANGAAVQVEAGKDYTITVWMMVPQGGHNRQHSVWFTAVPEDKLNTLHSNSFNKNDYIIGSELNVDQTVAKTEWQQITYTVDDCAHSGYLRIGVASYSNSNPVTFYIDDITVEGAQNVPAEAGAWSFETEAENASLSLNGQRLTVTKEAKHSGKQAVRVNSTDSSGNGRPQMMVKDANGAVVQVEAGKDYLISFWAMVPQGGRNDDYSVWFTAVAENKQSTAHSSSFNKNDSIIGSEQTIPQSVAKGEWQKITYEVDNCAYSGYLRLGIAGHGAGNTAVTMYLDDIKVEETVIEILPVEEGVWSFETEAVNTALCLNATPSQSIVVTKDAKHAGTQAVRVNAATSTGNGRPQMNVKNADGNLIAVEAGKDYRITFWAMVPTGGHSYPYNVWFTAVPQDKVNTAHDNSFNKNSYIIGSEQEIAQTTDKGEWQQITYEVDDCGYSGYLRLGIAGHGAGNTAVTMYLDDIKVEETVIEILPVEEGAWSFETENKDTTLDINASTSEIITVTGEAKHAGTQAVRVNASDSSGNARPQMNVKDADGNLVQVEAGKGYNISLWVMVPQGGHDYDYSIWFTAVDDAHKDVAHSSSYNKNDYIIDSELTVPQSAAKGEWQQITRYVEECAHSGYLRLGIAAAGANRNAVKFYVDDIKVTPVVAGDYEPQGFENYALGTNLAMNSDSNKTIIVTDEIASTGNQSARVNSNNSGGNERPQMMLKDANGRQFKVKKGRNYEVTFSVYIPETEVNYAVNYWLAVTTDEVCFSNGGQQKNDYVVAEKSDTDQFAKGVWNSVTIAITDCKFTGKLRLGITGNISRKPNDPHSFYIDDLNVVETIINGDIYTMSFEPYAKDTKLSLNTDGASITVVEEERRAGYQSAKFVTLGSNLDAAPQMTVNTFQLEPVKVEAGKRYRVTFWLFVPLGGASYDINYWFAVTNNDTAFSATNPKQNLVSAVQTVTIEEKGIWKSVMLTFDCAYTGTLRLGAAGSTDVPHTFYLDDIKVEERNNAPVDPDAMNFENLTVGENISVANNQMLTAIVTDQDSYTGNQSVYLSSNSNTGDARPQFNAVDGNGNLIKVKKGEDYFLTFAVMVPTSEDYFTFSYWAAAVPQDKLNDPFVRETAFAKNNYVIGEVSGGEQPTAGEWHVIKLAIMDCKYDGYLRVGFTHHNAPPFTSHMYIDDIKLNDPDYVTVKFETNGAENAEDYQTITVMSDTLLPTQEYVDPYRFGYEFMGWYTNPNFTGDSYFDIYANTVVGKNGDVITLYAMWEEWTETQAGEREESEDEFTIEYYTEKVWVGDQNVADPLTAGDAPNVNDAAPIVVTPEENPDDGAQGGMPPWLIVVIIVAAVVVVGGGAAIAAIMLRKSKKA